MSCSRRPSRRELRRRIRAQSQDCFTCAVQYGGYCGHGIQGLRPCYEDIPVDVQSPAQSAPELYAPFDLRKHWFFAQVVVRYHAAQPGVVEHISRHAAGDEHVPPPPMSLPPVMPLFRG